MHAKVFSVLKLFWALGVMLALGLYLPALPARADNFYAATLAQAAQLAGRANENSCTSALVARISDDNRR